MSDHSLLSPSGAHRWVHCPGSVTLSALYPDPSGSAAAEGEACHWVGSEVLSGRGGDAFTGRTAPNGVIVTDEMVDAAKVYVEAVRRICPPGVKPLVEHRTAVLPVHEQCFGTLDCGYQTKDELHIWDLKYGFGIVEPYENWQLVCYAAGLLADLTGLEDQKMYVSMHIVQPRPYHSAGPVRTWRVLASDLRTHINKLAHAAALALGPDPQATSGSQCKYCSARHACPAAQKAAMFAVDYTEAARADDLPPTALAIELRTLQRAADAIQYRLTGLEAQARCVIQSGGLVPGFALQNGAGRQQWNIPTADLFTTGDLMGVNLRKPPEPITPNQAKKAGLPDDLVASFSERTTGEAKLVPTAGTMAARVFSQEGA